MIRRCLGTLLAVAPVLGMPPSVPPAHADDAVLVQVRLGNASPWLGPASGLNDDGGAGGGARLLGVPGTSPWGTPWTASLPGWLRWALEPQAQFASSTEAVGIGGRGYRGLSWSVPLASGVLHQDDGLRFGFSVGQSLGDLSPGNDVRDRRSWPGGPLLRLEAGIGYQVTPRLGLYVLFDHQAASGPLREDESQNDLGIRVGLRF